MPIRYHERNASYAPLYSPLDAVGNDLLAATARGGVVRIDPATGGVKQFYNTGPDCVQCVSAIASNSDTVAVARNASDGHPEVILFDAETGGVRFSLPLREMYPSGIHLDLSDRYLAAASYFDEFGTPVPQADRGLVDVFELKEGRLVGSFVSPASEFYNDWFGSDVALLGDALLVGAKWDNISGLEDGGAVCVFKFVPDINLDGAVNIFDINLVSSRWGEAGPQGDANGDGVVNIFDINLISSNWGAGGVTAVPEPAAWLLTLLAALGLVVKFRRGCRAKS